MTDAEKIDKLRTALVQIRDLSESTLNDAAAFWKAQEIVDEVLAETEA